MQPNSLKGASTSTLRNSKSPYKNNVSDPHILSLQNPQLKHTTSSKTTESKQLNIQTPKLAMAKPTVASYLTLPLELRQQILAYTFPDPLQKDLALNRHLLHINYLFYYRPERTGAVPSPEVFDTPFPTPVPNIHNWATTLIQAHESIASDLPFVLKPQVEEVEETAKKTFLVGKLLHPAGCEEYIDLFLGNSAPLPLLFLSVKMSDKLTELVEHNITTETALANLNRDKLKEIGVESLSDQVRIAWHASGWRIAAK